MKIILLDSYDAPLTRATLIADSARRPDRRPLFVPDGEDGCGGMACTVRPCLRISRLGKSIAAAFASRYYDAVSVVNVMLPEREQFAHDAWRDDTLVEGSWIELDRLPADISVNGTAARLALDTARIDEAIHRLSAGMTFKTGDMLVLPQVLYAYRPVAGTSLIATLDNQPILEFNIK